jgi:hypothetical protein
MDDCVRKTVVFRGKEWITDPSHIELFLFLKRNVRSYTCMYKEMISSYGVSREFVEPFEVLHDFIDGVHVATVVRPKIVVIMVDSIEE